MNEEKTISKIQLGLILKSILLFLVLDLSSAWAQKGEITVFGSYRIGGGLEEGTFSLAEQAVVGNLKIQNSPDFGLSFGVWLVKDAIMLEFIIERQPTELSQEVRKEVALFDLNIDYYQVGLVWPFGTKTMGPFIAFSLGAAYFGPKGDFKGKTGITSSYGIGFKTFVKEHLGFRFQSRFTATGVSGTSPRSTFMFQLDISGGVILAF